MKGIRTRKSVSLYEKHNNLHIFFYRKHPNPGFFDRIYFIHAGLNVSWIPRQIWFLKPIVHLISVTGR